MNVKVALACVAILALNAVACGKSGESSSSETKAPETKVDMNAAKEMYESRCSSCHGVSGKGDGPGAAALNPKPRNFADSAWNKSIKDDQLRKTIIYGGAAVGKSPIMPASPDLDAKPEVVDGLIKMVRSFGGHLNLAPSKKERGEDETVGRCTVVCLVALWL